MRILLAPMEGLVDSPIREVLTGLGGIDQCVSEFIRVTHSRLPDRVFHKFAPELLGDGCCTKAKVPVAIQLLGSDADQMAAHGVIAHSLGARHIDINFGCPAKTVNRHKGGCVLMREPESLHCIVKAVRQAVPDDARVTAKMRLGYDDRSMGIACATAIAEAGADELVVHARSKVDGYRPPAYWEELAPIREAVPGLPVVANGEIWTVDDYWRCRDVSGCEDVMIGRGLISRPDLALAIKASQLGLPRPEVAWNHIAALVLQYGDHLSAFLEQRFVMGRLKQWLNYLRRGYPDAGRLWSEARRCKSLSELEALLLREEGSPGRNEANETVSAQGMTAY